MEETSEQRDSSSKLRSSRHRLRENEVFAELLNVLPHVQDSRHHKVTILRLLVAYLKCRRFIEEADREHDGMLHHSRQDQAHTSSQAATVNISHDALQSNTTEDNGKNVAQLISHNQNIILPTCLANEEDELRAVVSSLNPSVVGLAKDTKSKLEHYRQSLELGMREFLGYTSIQYEVSAQEIITGGQSSTTGRHLIMHTPQWATPDKKFVEHQLILGEQETESIMDEQLMIVSQDKVSRSKFFGDKLPEIDFESNLILEAARGFLLILDKKLTIIFVSENVSHYIGFSQVQLIGQSIEILIDDANLTQLRKNISLETFPKDSEATANPDATKRMFFMDLKYCFQKKQSKHKVTGKYLFHWNVRLRLTVDKLRSQTEIAGLVSVCQYIPMDTILYVHNDGNLIKCRMSLELKMLQIDPIIEIFSGFMPQEMKTKDAYSIKHPNDVFVLHNQHKIALIEGKANSGYYRMINRNGDFVWVFSRMEVIKNKQSYLQLNCYIVSPKEAEAALCQDEEEYKRFKCEGFGRAFHTTQRNYSHCMTGSETEPIHPHFQSVLTGTKQCSLQMPVSEVQQDMTEAKSLIITTGKEDGNSSKSKHSYKFAKIFKDSQKNLKIPYKQINEEQANKTDGLINSNASSVYTSHPTIPEYVDLDDFELGIICNRNDHRYSISMSSALSGSPSTVTVQEGDGSVEENENLIESLLEESIISNREVMESFGTGVESRAVSQASSSIAPKTVVESSSFLTPLPLLRSTEIVDDSLPLEDIQPSVKLDGKERIMLNQIQIDETDPSAFADILNNGIIDKLSYSRYVSTFQNTPFVNS
ncbi:hypothetical protein RRG08_022253 [Elysia crispata]|uniref:Uncharacterized protein n=1 Tax=Elysia crispata TaxID=231223 RepID=A0AAE0ZR70_9GAST|nr:hypothetical protein RRG08_022253 [Elysia crispata]